MSSNSEQYTFNGQNTDMSGTLSLKTALPRESVIQAQSRQIYFRKVKDLLFKSTVLSLAIISTIPLFLIFFFIFRQGIKAIFPNGLMAFFSDKAVSFNWNFFLHLPAPVGESGGGIVNAIIGSGLLIILASVISVPIGILVGIFLSEYRSSKISYWIGLCMEILQGIPSIVIGIIAYIWVVGPMRGFSMASGAIALGFMMLPVIARTTEETLKLVPSNLKAASLALGAPYYITILKVVVPAGLSGIITGILVSVARIAGETAPLLFTAFGNPYINTNISKPVESIPHIIYYYATSPYEDWQTSAWGASLVLVLFVLLINMLAKFFTRRWNIR